MNSPRYVPTMHTKAWLLALVWLSHNLFAWYIQQRLAASYARFTLPSFLECAIIDDKMLSLDLDPDNTLRPVSNTSNGNGEPTKQRRDRSGPDGALPCRNCSKRYYRRRDMEWYWRTWSHSRGPSGKFPTNPHRDDLSLNETDVLKTKILVILNEHHHLLINYLRQQKAQSVPSVVESSSSSNIKTPPQNEEALATPSVPVVKPFWAPFWAQHESTRSRNHGHGMETSTQKESTVSELTEADSQRPRNWVNKRPCATTIVRIIHHVSHSSSSTSFSPVKGRQPKRHPTMS